MNIRMKRGMALVLMASLLLAGSAQALFGLGKSKPETVSPENGPTARDLEIRTYRGIPYLGQLEAADPDGGELTFAIDVQPKKGTVTVEGASFTYTPRDNALGADSFTYTAANSAGAVSQSATVTVTIEKTRSGVTYADTGEATATAAQDLAERGVFTGAKIGDKWYFEPDRTVSRGEFLAMVLETAGAEVTDVMTCPPFAVHPYTEPGRDALHRCLTYMGNLGCGRGQPLLELGQTLDALLCVYDDGAALYLDDAVQTNVGTLSFPAQMEGVGERFLSGDFADLDSDGNSDAALRFTQEDGSEIVMTWLWDAEAEGYVFRDAADAG